MAQQVLAPINLGLQAEAVAGSQGVTFTATDRQVIKERAGEVDRTKSFKEIFIQRDLAPKVENELSTVNPEVDLRAMESRKKEHRRMLKYSALAAPREHVEITNEYPEPEIVIAPPVATINSTPAIEEKAEIVIEKTADTPTEATAEKPAETASPAAAFDQISAEQNGLQTLIFRIKDLHFKRLLSITRAEFEKYTDEIKNETLAANPPGARSFLEPKIDLLTKRTAEYKLKLMQSLETMHYDDEHKKDVHWLQKIIDKYSAATA